MGASWYFDETGNEWVSLHPERHAPVLNAFGNASHAGVCSDAGGGFAARLSSTVKPLSRYALRQVPPDSGGRYVYIHDGANVWNPAWKPMRMPLARYECRHGQGYSWYKSAVLGLECEQLVFVPPKHGLEIWRLSFRNSSDAVRKLNVFAVVDLCFQTVGATVECHRYENALYLREQAPAAFATTAGDAVLAPSTRQYVFLGCTRPILGYDTDRDAFLGLHAGWETPQQVFCGKPGNSNTPGSSPIAALCVELDLEPGVCESFSFVLGACESSSQDWDVSEGRWLLAGLSEPGVIDGSFRDVLVQAAGQRKHCQFQIPPDHVRVLMNFWYPQACLASARIHGIQDERNLVVLQAALPLHIAMVTDFLQADPDARTFLAAYTTVASRLAYFELQLAYIRESGDAGFVERCLSAVSGFVRELMQQRSSTGLIAADGPDCSALVLSGKLLGLLKQASTMYSFFGHEAEAATCDDWYADIMISLGHAVELAPTDTDYGLQAWILVVLHGSKARMQMTDVQLKQLEQAVEGLPDSLHRRETGLLLVQLLCCMGRGNDAWRWLQLVCPEQQVDSTDLDYAGQLVPATMQALAYQTCSAWILGVRADAHGLMIDPCIPASWKQYGCTRMFRGHEYRIQVDNPDGVCAGVVALTVDGMPAGKRLVPLPVPSAAAGTVHEVQVLLGKV